MNFYRYNTIIYMFFACALIALGMLIALSTPYLIDYLKKRSKRVKIEKEIISIIKEVQELKSDIKKNKDDISMLQINTFLTKKPNKGGK